MKRLHFPDKGEVFDYLYNVETREVQHWTEHVPDFFPGGGGGGGAGTVMVPTVNTTRLYYLMDLLMQTGSQVLLVGNTGSGKSMMINDYLRSSEEKVSSANISVGYYTVAKTLQFQLEDHIDRRSGKIFGPTGPKKLVYFIDDLNMPFVEEYGTQTPIALLRQYMDYSSWFDRTDLSLKKEIQDVQFAAAMNPKSGSFNINPRLQRHFTVFACLMPSKDDLTMIYTTILDAHMSSFGRLRDQCDRLVEMTLELHAFCANNFLPSAVKFHYNFNMRELSRVVFGLCQAVPEFFTTVPSLVRLWVHENCRVFGDRLVGQNEIKRFAAATKELTKKYYEAEDQAALHAEPLVFTSFAKQSLSDTQPYLAVETLDQLKGALEKKLSEYNDVNPIMNLILFRQAMEHTCRIARIIERPNGNAMLVGVGGSGKQSLTRLASFICGYDVIQLQISSSFSVSDLKESLKEMYKKAGVKPATPIVFLLTDNQITNEEFLVYVNYLLQSGYIPDLYTKEEYDGIFSALRNAAKAAGVPESRSNMMEFFLGRVRSNLHVVLCFSPIGDQFRIRARRFPALVNCTSIDWFHPWPREALISVAGRFLDDMDVGSDERKENIAHHMAMVHLSVTKASETFLQVYRRQNHVTAKSFLELISFYKSLLGVKKKEVQDAITRLDTGLTTLRRTAADVAELKIDLVETLKRVDEKKEATVALLAEMAEQRGEAEKQQAVANVERQKTSELAANAAQIAEKAADELGAALPALDAATEAVACLNKANLTELKNFSKPPAGVDKVTTACLIMIKREKKNFG